MHYITDAGIRHMCPRWSYDDHDYEKKMIMIIIIIIIIVVVIICIHCLFRSYPKLSCSFVRLVIKIKLSKKLN